MQGSGGSNNIPSSQNLGVTPTNQITSHVIPSQEEGKSSDSFKTSDGNPYSSSTNNDYYSSDSYKTGSLKSYGSDDPRERNDERRNDPVSRNYQDPRSSNPTTNYQPQTTTPSFNPSSYQQSYMAPKQQYPTLKREPSSSSINSRTEVPLASPNPNPNIQQRPFQTNPPQPRPPTTQPVKSMQPPQKPPSYSTPAPAYPTNPPSRPQMSSAPSYSRPMAQRPISTTPGSQFITSPSYTSTPNRTAGLNLSQDPSRWSGTPIRPPLTVPNPVVVPNDDKKSAQMSEAEKLAMQAKFKNMIRPKIETSEISPTPPTIPTATRDILQKPPMTLDSTRTAELKDDDDDEFDEAFTDEENELDDEDDISLASPQNEPNQISVKSENFLPTSDTDTSVMKNIKFFEKNDKAKVPLTPRPIMSTPKKSPVRPNSINIVNALQVTGHEESGVDTSPVKHPNLRSIAEVPLKVAKVKQRSSKGRSSYPGTPKKTSFAPLAMASMPQTPKRQPSTPGTPKKVPSAPMTSSISMPQTPRHFSPYTNTQFYQAAHREGARKQSNGMSNGASSRGVSASPVKSPGTPKSPGALKSPATPKSAPKTPDALPPAIPLIKKIPMNKIQVGSAPSPNLKTVKSKIGSLSNASHKPGGGNIRIQSQKLDFSTAQPRIANKNDHYLPSGGEKKIPQVKLQWNAKSKVGSLENAAYQPGGGEKKIESQKLDFKERARSRVGSKDNVKYTPGGGDIKIETKKLEFNAQSKIGSLENVKHKPGGGNVQIFDDKSFIKGAKQQSNCDLAVVTEVRGMSESAEDEATDIRIKKITTIASTQPTVVKTTQVTVVSRSPSKERRDVGSAGSTHQVKLTYSTTTVPSDGTSHVAPARQPDIVHQPPVVEPTINKLLQNEQATHEKVGEMWKEAQNTPA